MAKLRERQIVRSLRQKGYSIRDISKQAGIAKSSVSLWCRDLTLTQEQRDLLKKNAIIAGRKGRLAGASKNKERKIQTVTNYIQEGKRIAAQLSEKEFLLIGAAMYWGEGSKVGQLSFINSDSKMILFMYSWFRQALGIERDRFIPRVFVNAIHKDRRQIIERYWSRLLNIPPEQFRNTVFLRRASKKVYPNHDKYFGLLALRIKNSTDLKYKILGLIEGIKYSTFEK